MAIKYILARTLREAHTFASDVLGLERGYRVVNSAGTLKAVRGADLYLAPGWEKRFDRFQMKSALRWTYMNVIDMTESKAPESQPDVPAAETPVIDVHAFVIQGCDDVPDGLSPAGVQPSLLSPEDQADLGRILEPVGFEVPATLREALSSPEEQGDLRPLPDVVEEDKPKTRRRRCKDCGVLVSAEEMDAHVADHLPTED